MAKLRRGSPVIGRVVSAPVTVYLPTSDKLNVVSAFHFPAPLPRRRRENVLREMSLAKELQFSLTGRCAKFNDAVIALTKVI